MDAEPVENRREARALAIGGLVALAVAVGIGRFVYTPILPLMVEDLGMTKGAAGLVASANFAGYLAGALLAATAVVSGSRRRWLLAGLAVSAVTTGAMAFASSMPVFLILRFAGGVASAFGLVFASALALDGLAAAGRSELSAVHFAGVGVGIAVSALLSWGIAALDGGWRAIWLASGAVAAGAVGAVARLIPDRSGPAVVTGSRPNRIDRRLAAFVVAYGLFGFGYIITATFLVAIVRDGGYGRAFEPIVWLVVGLTAAPSVAFWTWIARRVGIARAFALACVAEAIGVAASVLQTTVAVLLGAALLGGTFMGLTALGLIGARRLAAGDPRSTLAIMTAAFGLGQIIAPAFAGLVYDATASFALPSLAAGAALLVAALLALTTPVETQVARTS
jgi:predicted MFS family arabinose efflux permease